MANLHINFPSTLYSHEATNKRLAELGAPKSLYKEDQSRAEMVRESVIISSRMAWGEVKETSITLTYTGAIPRGVEINLQNLKSRGVITSWGKA